MFELNELVFDAKTGGYWRLNQAPSTVQQASAPNSLAAAIRAPRSVSALMPETQLQIAVIEWLRRNLPAVADVTFANLGGMKLTPASAKIQHALGYQAGTPDLFIAYPSQGFCGLFLELKTETGRASTAQIGMIERLRTQGFCAEITYGFDATVSTIRAYLNPC